MQYAFKRLPLKIPHFSNTDMPWNCFWLIIEHVNILDRKDICAFSWLLLQLFYIHKSRYRLSGRYGTYVKTINETCLREDCIYDEASPNIWARRNVIVKKVRNQNPIKKESKSDKYDSTSADFKKSNVTWHNETHFELLLTPPIIMIWAYELGFALSEGKHF